MSSWARRAAAAAALAAAAAAPAAAKVSFTGYGSFGFAADANLRVYAAPALLAGTPEGTLRARGFSTDAVGLFAATPVAEDADFLMDVSYRSYGGQTVRDLRVQYAYLDAGLGHGLRLQAGKVTLPFGYFNSRRFYPFQRVELSAPLFQSSILGLPIADTGGVLAWRGEAEGLALDLRFFGVNGYGSVPTSTGSFRTAAVPGGLSVANNLGPGNNNRDVAVGGQAALSVEGGWETGLSCYRGAWDRSGERMFRMLGAHVHGAPWGFDVLAEFLRLEARGDEGMERAFGSRDWDLDGGFLAVSRPAGALAGRPLTLYGRGELYRGAASDGRDGHEQLRSAAAGASLAFNERVTWKGEWLWLDYTVPSASSKSLRLIGYVTQFALVVTF